MTNNPRMEEDGMRKMSAARTKSVTASFAIEGVSFVGDAVELGRTGAIAGAAVCSSSTITSC